MMDDIRVPIYLVTGFLESGKTTFLDFTLQQEYFAIDGKNSVDSLRRRRRRI